MNRSPSSNKKREPRAKTEARANPDPSKSRSQSTYSRPHDAGKYISPFSTQDVRHPQYKRAEQEARPAEAASHAEVAQVIVADDSFRLADDSDGMADAAVCALSVSSLVLEAEPPARKGRGAHRRAVCPEKARAFAKQLVAVQTSGRVQAAVHTGDHCGPGECVPERAPLIACVVQGGQGLAVVTGDVQLDDPETEDAVTTDGHEKDLEVADEVLSARVIGAVQRGNRHYETHEVQGIVSERKALQPTTMRCMVDFVGPAGVEGGVRRGLALIDGGAEVSVIHTKMVPDSCVVKPSGVNLTAAFGKEDSGCGRTAARVMNMGVLFPLAHAFTTNNLKGYDAILGIDWLREARVRIQYAPTPHEETLHVTGIDPKLGKAEYRWSYEFYKKRMHCVRVQALEPGREPETHVRDIDHLADTIPEDSQPTGAVWEDPVLPVDAAPAAPSDCQFNHPDRKPRVIKPEVRPNPAPGDPCKLGPEDLHDQEKGDSRADKLKELASLAKARLLRSRQSEKALSEGPEMFNVDAVTLSEPASAALNSFSINLGSDLQVPARTELMVPVSMVIPTGRDLASAYIIEGTVAMEKMGLLVSAVQVQANELDLWQFVVVNPTVNTITVSAAIASLAASRVWDPGRDGSNIPPTQNSNDTPVLVARKIAALEREQANSALSDVAKALGHSDQWRGERYDPANPEHVDQLLAELGLDSMHFEAGEGLTSIQKRDMARKLFLRFMDCHAKDSLSPGRSNLEPMKVPLKRSDQTPIRSAPYRAPPLYRDFIAEQINKLLAAGSLQVGQGPWASPVAVVRHSSGKLRLVCDYRRVNQLTKLDAHPLPDLEVILQQLGEMKHFSCVDLCSGYHQVGLDTKARELSAIATHLGLFEWTVTPFGLGGAPSHFSRCMAVLLCGMTYRNAMSFIDDVLIYSRTFRDHIKDLTEFFLRLRKHLVSLKPTKCTFFAQSATYLGFTLSRHGLDTVAAKVEAICGIGAPKSLTELRSWLQMVNFYRRFLKNLSMVAKPLTDLTRKVNLPFKPWEAGSNEDKAFLEVKRILSSAPLLRHPRSDLAFNIEVDASSKEGLGAVLTQDFPVEDLDDLPDAQRGRRATVRLPIHFASRKLRGGEPNYAPAHLEACGVLWALDQFRHYILGRPCNVFTDHGPLTWLLKPAARENSQLARYALRLQEYQPWIEVQYKPGRVHSVPDAMSRLPIDMTGDTKELEDLIVPPEYYLHAVEKLSTVPQHHVAKSEERKATDEDWGRELLGLFDESEFMCKVREEQRAHPKIGGLIQFLEGGPAADKLPPAFKTECEANRHSWLLESGFLRRVVRVPAVKNAAGNVLSKAQVLTPLVLSNQSPLIEEVQQALHDHPTAAHIGRNKMTELMRSRFYWYGWAKDVADYVRSCHWCQRYKALRRLKPSALMPFHSPRPMHTLGIDLIGPLPSAKGMKYCLTVICHFGSWLWIIPLPSKEPKAVAWGLYNHVILGMCIPLFLLSDRGGEFCNQVMEHLCKLLGLKHKKSVAWHPATNGLIENAHKFIKKSLAITAAQHGRKWIFYVSELEFAWRHSHLAWAKTTPFAITVGFEGPLPIDLLTASPATLLLDGARFHAAHLARLASSWQMMDQRRDEAERKMTGDDKDAQPVLLLYEGTEVIAWLPSKVRGSQAFTTKWKGPFIVMKRLGLKTYRLRDTKSGREFSCNVDNLHPYRRRHPTTTSLPDSAPKGREETTDHWASRASVEPEVRVCRLLHRTWAHEARPRSPPGRGAVSPVYPPQACAHQVTRREWPNPFVPTPPTTNRNTTPSGPPPRPRNRPFDAFCMPAQPPRSG